MNNSKCVLIFNIKPGAKRYVYTTSDDNAFTASQYHKAVSILKTIPAISKKIDIDAEVHAAKVNAAVDTPLGHLWYLLHLLNDANLWSSTMIKLGILGVDDDAGLGLIHENEPKQCVIFTPQIIDKFYAYDNPRHVPDADDN